MDKEFEVTLAAAEKIKAISSAEKKEGYGLRIRAMGGGCSGTQHQLGLEEKATDGDQVYDSNGLKVFIDTESIEFVRGATLDFIEGPNGAGFKISNPNEAQGGGCGSGGGGGCGSGGCGSHEESGDHHEEKKSSGGGCGSGGCGCG